MKKTAILIDDDAFVHKDVRFRLKAVPDVILLAAFFSTDEAVEYIATHGDVDVIFADIRMPDKDGYEANRLLSGHCRLFIFLTQKDAHGEEIFSSASMVHYLRKPIDVAAFSLILRQMECKSQEVGQRDVEAEFVFLYERGNYQQVLVKIKDILMIQFQGKYGTVTLATEKTLIIHGTVATTLRQLRAMDWFIRISKDTILSMRAISRVDAQLVIYLTWGETVPVKRTYQPAFRAFMDRNGLG